MLCGRASPEPREISVIALVYARAHFFVFLSGLRKIEGGRNGPGTHSNVPDIYFSRDTSTMEQGETNEESRELHEKEEIEEHRVLP